MERKIVVRPGSEILLSAKKKGTIELWKDMEEIYVHIAHWKKPIWKVFMVYESH